MKIVVDVLERLEGINKGLELVYDKTIVNMERLGVVVRNSNDDAAKVIAKEQLQKNVDAITMLLEKVEVDMEGLNISETRVDIMRREVFSKVRDLNIVSCQISQFVHLN
jgi:hypothetical protein